jgi:hypothetical protein
VSMPASTCRILARLAIWRGESKAAASLRTLAAAVALSALCCTACSGAPSPHPVISTASASTAPSSCLRQYMAWRHGPVSQASRQLATQLRVVGRAARAPAFGTLRSALRPLVPTALALAAQPMPRCADTSGIYANLVLRVYESGANARSAKRLSTLLHAAARLARTRDIERQLTAEVVRALGSAHCQISDTGPAWPPC